MYKIYKNKIFVIVRDETDSNFLTMLPSVCSLYIVRTDDFDGHSFPFYFTVSIINS